MMWGGGKTSIARQDAKLKKYIQDELGIRNATQFKSKFVNELIGFLSMYNFYSTKDERKNLLRQTIEVEYLLGKGLINEASKRLSKIEQTNSTQDYYDIPIRIVYIRHTIIVLQSMHPKFEERIDAFDIQCQKEVERLKVDFAILKYSLKQRVILEKNSPYITDELMVFYNNFKNDPLLNNNKLRLRQKIAFKNIEVASLSGKLSIQELYDKYQEIIALCEENYTAIEKTEHYFMSLSNALSCITLLGKKDLFDRDLAKLKKYSEQKLKIDRVKKASFLVKLYQLNYYVTHLEFEKAHQFILETPIKKHSQFNEVSEIVLKRLMQFLVFKTYFVMHDFENAKHWGNKILSNKKTYSLRKDITNATLVMDCFLSYELFAQNQLEYDEMLKKIDKHHKTLKKLMEEDEKTERYETFIIKKFKRIVNGGINKQEHIEQFKRLQKESATYLKENPHAVAFSAFFNIPAWLNSKIQGISLAESYCSF